jgi:hypothetical protein
MTQTINDNLQVNGDLNAGNTIYAVGHPVGSQDYVIDLLGSTTSSLPPNITALTVNGQSLSIDNVPGINTAILNPNGTLKAKHSHSVQDPTQWNSWADWVNTTAAATDVVAVASSGIPTVPPPPQSGSAVALLQSFQIPTAWPPSLPIVLLFIKGHTGGLGMGGWLPPQAAPPASSTCAEARTSYHRLLKPFSGCVGIGTTQPGAMLHIVADAQSNGLRVVSKEGGGDALSIQGSSELVGYVVVRAPAGGPVAEFSVLGGDVKLCITESGAVGIGTPAPSHRLHVVAPDAVGLFESSGGQAYLRLITNEGMGHRVEITNRPGGRFSVYTPGGGDQFNITSDGNVGIGTTAPRVKLDVGGNVIVNGTVGIGTAAPQAKLHVVGDIIATGDIVLQNADCAEEFTVKDSNGLEPGTVMVLGEEGSLHRSTDAYDKKVAGVISGAGDLKPGLILDKQPDSTNRMLIALMGKAHCKVDAQYAAIEVGDLLTTSPTCGHAMKATDPTRAFGAVIGKALKPRERGTGLIPILISLQ